MTPLSARLKQFLMDLPLRTAIAVALIIGLVLPASLVAWRDVSVRRETLFDTLAKDHVRIVETLANGMQAPIWDVRPDAAKPLIDVIMTDSRITAVSVSAPVLTDPLVAGTPDSRKKGVLALERPVIRNGDPIGTVRVEMTAAPIEAEAVRQGWQAVLTAAFQIAFGLLLIFPLIRFKVLAPVGRLLDQSRELAAGHLSDPFGWKRLDELGALGRSFETTRRSLDNLFRDLEQRNSELRARETELSRQTRVLRATLENMNDGITLVDGDLRLLAWNDRFVEMSRLSADDVREGRSMLELYPIWAEEVGFPEPKSVVVDRMREGFQRGKPFSTQIELPHGQFILLRRRPMPDGGFVSTYTDVTEQVQARRKADATLQLLDAVIDAVPAILHVKDRDLRYEFVNRYFLDLFGLRRDEVLGHKLTEVMRQEWLSEFEDRGPEVIATGKALPFYEMAIWRPDGRRLEMLGSKVPLLDANEDVSHVVTFEIDITDRKRMQQALSDSEELYRLLVDLSPYGIVLHDAAGILFMNSAGCRILGASGPEAVVGRNYLEFIAVSDRQEGEKRLKRILEIGESLDQTERHLVRLDGRDIVVATTGVPFTRGDHRLALILFVDITEMKRAEEEIARQRDALHQAEKITAFGSLLAGVAHELNNPLSVVVGRATMLGEMDLEPSVATGIAKISAAAERCSSIVKTFLAMARQQPPTRVYVDLNALIESSLDLLGYGLSSSGIRIVKNLSADLPGTMADPEQLTQVITNLLINAKQAMDNWNGPRELSVDTTFDPLSNQIEMRVADSGPGIAEEVIGRVFDPFFTTKSVGAGTGIGLAVCRGIVEAHGGSITAENADTGGAVLLVTLPVIGAPSEPHGVAPAETTEQVARNKILVVDDEDEIRSMLSEILAAEGHLVEDSENGRDALARLANDTFDLIISDLIMPVLDGAGLYEELCHRHPEMVGRLIFITGDTLSPATRRFLKRAKRPVIEKPFNPADVRSSVSQALSGETGSGADVQDNRT